MRKTAAWIAIAVGVLSSCGGGNDRYDSSPVESRRRAEEIREELLDASSTPREEHSMPMGVDDGPTWVWDGPSPAGDDARALAMRFAEDRCTYFGNQQGLADVHDVAAWALEGELDTDEEPGEISEPDLGIVAQAILDSCVTSEQYAAGS